jgi:hypothetical protein
VFVVRVAYRVHNDVRDTETAVPIAGKRPRVMANKVSCCWLVKSVTGLRICQFSGRHLRTQASCDDLIK